MIDRSALVTRHNPTLHAFDALSPLSVGNGNFAFTCDATGLQTFPTWYENAMPLHTMSSWGWHTSPPPHPVSEDNALEWFEVGEREVPYLSGTPDGRGYSPDSEWLRANPHRLDLGRFSLILSRDAKVDEVRGIEQTLVLWEGRIKSRFEFRGAQVGVETVCHPHLDVVAVRIEAQGLLEGVGVRLAFPYGSEGWKGAANWEVPGAHRTEVEVRSNRADFERFLDNDRYFASLEWAGKGEAKQSGVHEFELKTNEPVLEACLGFSPKAIEKMPSFAQTREAARDFWAAFWKEGAALELAQSRDERALELERRVVLSQYQTAINCAGVAPPQETGLVCNSWHGKFHLEMHFWHAAHFAAWNRIELLERSLGWYQQILPVARENAARQGYAGARWPKMVSPDGRDSPSNVGVFLIWQQAHPLLFAELCFRAHPETATLQRWADLVFETAEFMASYARQDETGRFVLGPALIPAQESYGQWKVTNLNPPMELVQWHHALGVAQMWRERLGLERVALWDEVRDHLSALPLRDGIYAALETEPFLIRRDHPSMLGALGVLPATPLVDAKTMEHTLESVLKNWDWPSTWGWDYPMIAMTAARVGRPDLAIQSLFLDSPKNRYLPNGHNYQETRLPLYLPGNGGLLLAVALMAGGWDGAPTMLAPGFPSDGNWTVKGEDFRVVP
ncbi:hypothetical protein IAD21_04457 [Abditibacteriota bacterium]|nr:hypothetical protein IAD21_04457 [Abditibacteriota bacterium]